MFVTRTVNGLELHAAGRDAGRSGRLRRNVLVFRRRSQPEGRRDGSASSGFQGLDDPHLTLIRFDASSGAFWENPGGTLQVLAAFMKSVLTGRVGQRGNAGTMEL